MVPPDPKETPARREARERLLGSFDEDAFNRLYDELEVMAQAHLDRRPEENVIDSTALLHEAYLHAVQSGKPLETDAPKLKVLMSRLMRRVLIDGARRRKVNKRGDRGLLVDFALEELPATERPTLDLLALDEALDRLREHSETEASVVELRTFMGLTLKETAEALGFTRARAEREWRQGRKFLSMHLGVTSADTLQEANEDEPTEEERRELEAQMRRLEQVMTEIEEELGALAALCDPGPGDAS